MLDQGKNREVRVAFCLFARCTVEYEGRASSRLAEGDYLIVHKADGSTQIHGGERITPLNYQPPGGKLYVERRTIYVRRKRELITIHVRQKHFLKKLELSAGRPVLVRTEQDIMRELLAGLGRHLPGYKFVSTKTEARTEAGPCDLLCVDEAGVHHVFEAKRAQITLNAVVQLGKYVDALRESGKEVRGYVAAPRILKNARRYADQRGIRFLEVAHPTERGIDSDCPT